MYVMIITNKRWEGAYMTHMHLTAWVLALILFFVAIGLYKAGKHRGFKIIHMILRVFYLLIIATGAELIFRWLGTITPLYWVKIILGILVIAFFEMVLVFTKKGKSTVLPWLLLVIAFVATVYLGFDLPLGL
jgi:hypothetical protein